MLFLRLLIFFKIYFFKKFFQEQDSVSNNLYPDQDLIWVQTVCKVISRRQKSPLTCKELKIVSSNFISYHTCPKYFRPLYRYFGKRPLAKWLKSGIFNKIRKLRNIDKNDILERDLSSNYGILGWTLSNISFQLRCKPFSCPSTNWTVGRFHIWMSRRITLSPPVTSSVVCSSGLLMFLASLYCKQYGPRLDCSLGSSLIWAHIVCFLELI